MGDVPDLTGPVLMLPILRCGGVLLLCVVFWPVENWDKIVSLSSTLASCVSFVCVSALDPYCVYMKCQSNPSVPVTRGSTRIHKINAHT